LCFRALVANEFWRFKVNSKGQLWSKLLQMHPCTDYQPLIQDGAFIDKKVKFIDIFQPIVDSFFPHPVNHLLLDLMILTFKGQLTSYTIKRKKVLEMKRKIEMKQIRRLKLILLLPLIISLNSCGDLFEDSTTSDEEVVLVPNADTHEEASDYTWDTSSEIQITLNGGSISINSGVATINGSTITFTVAGTYHVAGSLSNGQLVVNAGENDLVRIILDGVDISHSSSAPIYIKNCAKTILVLNEGSENFLTDGSTYTYEDAEEEEPNATLFSKQNLSICGTGSLTIDANFNDAINTKDGLVIQNGNFTITAADDGIRGKDYLLVHDGTFNIISNGDALKSDNEDDASMGFITIDKGTYQLVAGGDAIAAQTDVDITYGDFIIQSGGGSSSYTSSLSAKGIKGTVSVCIEGGNFNLNAADDALHTNGYLTTYGGNYTINSGDDALHADVGLIVNGGIFDIQKCYEGLESKTITLNEGTVLLVAGDDGINAADGSTTTEGPGGGMVSTGTCSFTMSGGFIAVESTGDGVDVNGSVVMSGGTLLINGPTSNGNAALDYDGSFSISGGFLVAVGSSGMAQAPGTSSTQKSVLVNLTSTQSAGSLVHIQNASGTELLSFKPTKKYQSVAFSSPALESGSYDFYLGGSHSGTASYGLYTDGTYSAGTKYTSFTVSSVVTKVGSTSGGGGGGW